MLARDLPPPDKRPVVAIVTAEITKDTLHRNGLYQNIFFLYLLFESMGAIPIFLVNEKGSFVFDSARCYTFEEFIGKPFRLTAFIEVGLNTQPHIRRFMRTCGAKIFRLYLGNVFNIDVETPIYYAPLNFTHHSTGDTDCILVSPHYSHYSDFLSSIDKTDRCEIAPYIWDPYFIQQCTTWRPTGPSTKRQFIIMEPNISFQKNALLPLLALEKTGADEIIVVNGDKLIASPYARGLIDSLKIRDKIVVKPRMTLAEVTREWPAATVISYHKDNELNYLTLEFMSLGFPVIHNAATWKNGGYYYAGDSINDCAAAIQNARQHAECLSVYRSQVQGLIWGHSIHNPQVQQQWAELLSI